MTSSKPTQKVREKRKTVQFDGARLNYLIDERKQSEGLSDEEIEEIIASYPAGYGYVSADDLRKYRSGKHQKMMFSKLLSIAWFLNVDPKDLMPKSDLPATKQVSSDGSITDLPIQQLAPFFANILGQMVNFKEGNSTSVKELSSELMDVLGSGELQLELNANTPGWGLRESRDPERQRKFEENLRRIALGSIRYLPGNVDIDYEPMDSDWILAFKEYAERVGNTNLQEMWRQVLAGQYTREATTSVQTLRIVQDLTVEVAQDFEKFCGTIFEIEGDCMSLRIDSLSGSKDYLKKWFDLDFGKVTRMSEYGLLMLGTVAYEAQPGEQLFYGSRVLQVKQTLSKGKSVFKYRANPLTNAGIEIYRLIERSSRIRRSDAYFEEILKLTKRDVHERTT